MAEKDNNESFKVSTSIRMESVCDKMIKLFIAWLHSCFD